MFKLPTSPKSLPKVVDNNDSDRGIVLKCINSTHLNHMMQGLGIQQVILHRVLPSLRHRLEDMFTEHQLAVRHRRQLSQGTFLWHVDKLLRPILPVAPRQMKVRRMASRKHNHMVAYLMQLETLSTQM